MKELQVKKNLDFLCLDYNLKYKASEFTNYLSTNGSVETYSYYNDFGCFTISNFAVKGELDYLVFKSIDEMQQCFLSKASISNFLINIFNYEQEIWKKNQKLLFFKNPFCWLNTNKTLRVLSEVIKSQIKKNGNFFGIKIKV